MKDEGAAHASAPTGSASSPQRRRVPRPGEPAPWFHAATEANPNFSFDTVAGHRVVLSFLGGMSPRLLRSLLSQVRVRRPQLDRSGCVFFGVTPAADGAHARLFKQLLPWGYLFLDHDLAVGRLYGMAPVAGQVHAAASFVLDERLRIVAVVPWTGDAAWHVAQVVEALAVLTVEVPETPAPVLVVPRIFEPALCRELIGYYERLGGQSSGFMRDVDGRTVLVHDTRHKRRKDRTIEDERLRMACQHRIHDRLLPEIEKAFQFRATRIERYLVACYGAEDAGHFRAHRDNTTRGTAHRRFAVSLNLNTGDYEGGHLRFPEFGRRSYQPPLGGAVVFSCSLLHEATPVTHGVRYAFLPFLYDEAAAEIRQKI